MDFGLIIIHRDSNIHSVGFLVMRQEIRAHKIVVAIIAHVQGVSLSSMLHQQCMGGKVLSALNTSKDVMDFFVMLFLFLLTFKYFFTKLAVKQAVN